MSFSIRHGIMMIIFLKSLILAAVNPVTRKKHRKRIGMQDMPWQEATADIDNHSFHILRTGHPQFKKRIAFVNEVSK